MTVRYDVVIRGGRYFDGTGAPASKRDVGIVGDRVAVVSAEPLDGAQIIDARGQWVTPGFIDLHTHYDAEVIAAPALTESLRHGVTTISMGSCSISTILSGPEDCSDMFTRVESIPREHVLPLLRARKSWSTPAEYVDFLDHQPLGPNVTAYLGHSDMRARVMGLGRSVDRDVRPSEAELADMEHWLQAGLDAGLLGLSTMTNPWDKLDGDRYRSKRLPSTYATWGEYRRLHRILRARGRILQSLPNVVTKLNAFAYAAESASWGLRPRLKTTLSTLADAKSTPGMHRVTSLLGWVTNHLLGGDLRWQTLPMPFEVYAEGIDLVTFEEFGAGRAALHLADLRERDALMADEAYRAQFRRDYDKRHGPRVWHRDFDDAFVVACPDPEIVGKSFGDVAKARGIHPVDAFLDLVIAHGRALRWRTTIANHRPNVVAQMVRDRSALVGFSDSGAHIRNMAFYSFALHLLRFVRDAERARKPVMPVEQAVWRLTGEIGDWLNIDAGHLRVGDRADLVVIDPDALDGRLDGYYEAPMEGLGGILRRVNRSDGVVHAVLIAGQLAFDERGFVPDLGRSHRFGRFLRAGARGSAARIAAGDDGGAPPLRSLDFGVTSG